jgi:hypothetical protein
MGHSQFQNSWVQKMVPDVLKIRAAFRTQTILRYVSFLADKRYLCITDRRLTTIIFAVIKITDEPNSV